MNFITSADLSNSKKDEFLLVDIRDIGSYSSGHIENSLQIDVYRDLKIDNIETVKKKLSTLPKGKTVITICNVGITAQKASKVLEELGYETKVLEGGMVVWAEENKVEQG